MSRSLSRHRPSRGDHALHDDFLETASTSSPTSWGFLDGFIRRLRVLGVRPVAIILPPKQAGRWPPRSPGDSLLFTVGALQVRGSMNVWLIAGLLVAGVLGDAVNYWVGKWIGPPGVPGTTPAAAGPTPRGSLNQRHLGRARFTRTAAKTVVLRRFVPSSGRSFRLSPALAR